MLTVYVTGNIYYQHLEIYICIYQINVSYKNNNDEKSKNYVVKYFLPSLHESDMPFLSKDGELVKVVFFR